MIISIPTRFGAFTFALNNALLKLLFILLTALFALSGYAAYQISFFLLTAQPEFYIRVLALLALVGITAIMRKMLKGIK